MKILRISLSNIASLAGTHTVDFTREPLRSAGLFSISGPTGSGKSTLLDALCLALYEKTPRLSGVKGNVKFDEGHGEITQQDPANLLRRGEGRGFADVAFVGVDGATYTARWTVRRARGAATGALQSTELFLFQGNVQPEQQGTVVEAGKKSDVLAATEKRIGLSFKQFTRAVLLAQNDFATFLKADDKERAEILQTLTGTERFELISQAVYARNSAETQALADIGNRMDGATPLAAEARAVIDADAARTASEYASAEALLATRMQHAEWFAGHARLVAELTQAEAAWRNAVAAREAANARQLELEQTGEVSRAARALRDAELRIACASEAARKAFDAATAGDVSARASLDAKTTEFRAAEKNVAAARAEYENAKPAIIAARALDARLPDVLSQWSKAAKESADCALAAKQSQASRDTLLAAQKNAATEVAELDGKIDGFSTVAPFAADVAVWLERMDAARAAQVELARLKSDADGKNLAVQKAATAADGARKVLEKSQSAHSAAEAVLAETAKSLAAFDPEAIAASRKSASAAIEDLVSIQHHVRESARVATQLGAVNVEIVKLRGEQERDVVRAEELRQSANPNAKAAHDAANRSLELAEAAISDASVALREKLAPGSECPVCGAKEHPFSEHPPSVEAAVIRALKNARDEHSAALAKLEAEQSALVAISAKRGEAIAEKSQVQASLIALSGQLNAVRFSGAAADEVFAMAEAQRDEELVRRIDSEKRVLKSAEDAELASRDASKKCDAARMFRDRTAAEVGIAEKIVSAAVAALSAINAASSAANEALAKAASFHENALAALVPIFEAIPSARAEWLRSDTAFRQKFAKDALDYTGLRTRRQEVISIAEKCAAALIPAEESVARFVAELAAKQQLERECKAAADSLKAERAGLFDGRSADVVETGFVARISALDVEVVRLSRETAECERQRSTCAEVLRSAALGLTVVAAQYSDAAAAMDEWIAAFGARTGRVLERSGLDAMLARSESWFSAEREVLSALDRGVQSSTGALEVHRAKHDAHLNTRPTQDDEQTVTTAVVALRDSLAILEKARDVARAAVLADDHRRAESSTLSIELERRKAAARPWQRLNDIIGSADGAKFRGIVQRTTLDVLIVFSNSQLRLLAPRYSLARIPESLNLIVVDSDMGDERRSVHSLSGGESFLVSLALALGLAALTSNRLRIESLFIDEGFGNLDTETLNVAMGALMRLESQGRKVGVISHVAEMADAIPVQISVVKGRAGSSRLVVPGAEFVAVPGVAVASPTIESVGVFAAKIVEILQRERTAGKARVSTRAIRDELGCDAAIFAEARSMLKDRVRTDGRSLCLPDEPAPFTLV